MCPLTNTNTPSTTANSHQPWPFSVMYWLSPHRLLFSRLKSLSTSPCERHSIPLMIFMAVSSNSSVSFWCWGPQCWMQDSRWDLIGVEQSGTVTWCHTFGATQATIGFLGCKSTLLVQIPFFISKFFSAELHSVNFSSRRWQHWGLPWPSAGPCT